MTVNQPVERGAEHGGPRRGVADLRLIRSALDRSRVPLRGVREPVKLAGREVRGEKARRLEPRAERGEGAVHD